MRAIHFDRTAGRSDVLPLCGAWGSMDSDWTTVADGVTCDACRRALGESRPGPAAPTPLQPR
jgi:hypothetical protein